MEGLQGSPWGALEISLRRDASRHVATDRDAPSCAPGWAFLIWNISRCIELSEWIDPIPGRDPKRQRGSI